jgi:hypothetical protein
MGHKNAFVESTRFSSDDRNRKNRDWNWILTKLGEIKNLI